MQYLVDAGKIERVQAVSPKDAGLLACLSNPTAEPARIRVYELLPIIQIRASKRKPKGSEKRAPRCR